MKQHVDVKIDIIHLQYTLPIDMSSESVIIRNGLFNSWKQKTNSFITVQDVIHGCNNITQNNFLQNRNFLIE